MGAHTHYSTDIPPLPPGADTVDEFLFGNRTGFCEQISTAMAVMLRSIGIPAREAVGYVPGSYNPITDLYEVQGKDAHAWVQVWFARYGWQSFDPTAVVPLANPSPGATLFHDAGRALKRLPLIPLGVGPGRRRTGRPRGRLASAPARHLGHRPWPGAWSGPGPGPDGHDGRARPSPSTPPPSTPWPATPRGRGARWPG